MKEFIASIIGIKHIKKSSITNNDGTIFTVIDRQFLGYESKSTLTCDADKTIGYSFTLITNSQTEAIEFMKAWLPTLEYKLGKPSINSFVSPYKEVYENDIKKGLIGKGSALVTWNQSSPNPVFLGVLKRRELYRVTWSW